MCVCVCVYVTSVDPRISNAVCFFNRQTCVDTPMVIFGISIDGIYTKCQYLEVSSLSCKQVFNVSSISKIRPRSKARLASNDSLVGDSWRSAGVPFSQSATCQKSRVLLWRLLDKGITVLNGE